MKKSEFPAHRKRPERWIGIWYCTLLPRLKGGRMTMASSLGGERAVFARANATSLTVTYSSILEDLRKILTRAPSRLLNQIRDRCPEREPRAGCSVLPYYSTILGQALTHRSWGRTLLTDLGARQHHRTAVLATRTAILWCCLATLHPGFLQLPSRAARTTIVICNCYPPRIPRPADVRELHAGSGRGVRPPTVGVSPTGRCP